MRALRFGTMFFMLSLFMSGFIFAGLGTADASERAIWVWSMAENIILDSPRGAQADFFNFCDAPHGNSSKRITVIYFSKSSGNRDLLSIYPNQMADFLTQAHARGLWVECLAGAKEWATPTGRGYGEQACADVINFNLMKSSAAARFNGVHFDVEPAELNGSTDGYDWTNDYGVIWGQYKLLLENCRAQIQSYNKSQASNMRFGVSIPWWFGATGAPGSYRDVQSRVDYVTLMDYRDQISLIVDGALSQISNADALGTKVYVGFDTSPAPNYPGITFYEEGSAEMERRIEGPPDQITGERSVYDQLVSHTGFGGFAIHYYEDTVAGERSYRKLRSGAISTVIFSPAKQLTSTSTDERICQAVAYKNEVYILWSRAQADGKYTLVLDKSRDNGRRWGALGAGGKEIVRDLPASSAPERCGKMVMNRAGGLYIGYTPASKLVIIKSVDGGNSFSPVGMVPSLTKPSSLDFAVNASGSIIYVAGISGSRRWELATSTDGGSTFGSVVTSPDPVSRQTISDIYEVQLRTSESGNEAYVCARANELTPPGYWRHRLMAARSGDRGKTLTGFRDVYPGEFPSGTAHHARDIWATVDSFGTLSIAWVVNDPSIAWSGDFALLSESSDGGNTFVHSRISDTGTLPEMPVVCADDESNAFTAFYLRTYDAQAQRNVYTLYHDEKILGKQFAADKKVAGPLLTDTIKARSLCVEPESGHAFCAWSDIPVALSASADLYGAVSLSSFPRLGIGNRRVTAGKTLNFTVAAPGVSAAPFEYRLYQSGDVNHDNMLTAADVLTIINMINSGVAYGDTRWDPEADLNNDGAITAVDVLTVINQVNAGKNRLPSGLGINSATGELSWTPASSQVGSYLLTVVSADGIWKDSETFTVTVTVSPQASAVTPSALSTPAPSGGEGEAGPLIIQITGSSFGIYDSSCAVMLRDRRTGACTQVQRIVDWQDTLITCEIPAAIKFGVYDVIVQTPGGMSDPLLLTIKSANMAVNPGMELGTTVPGFWVTYNNEYTSRSGWDAEIFHSGKRSLAIRNVRRKDAGWYGADIVFKGTYPRTLTLGGWSRARAVTGKPLYALDFYIEFTDGTYVWYYPNELRFASNISTWQYRGCSVSYDKPIRLIRPYGIFYCSGGGSGTVWFDDMSIYVM